MYTEIIRIIEGGLAGDKEKVKNYVEILINKLELEGESQLVKKIQQTLNSKRSNLVSLDGFVSKPVDGETRMEIIEVMHPSTEKENIVISREIEIEINNIVETYKNKDKLLMHGIDLNHKVLLYGPPGCGKNTLVEHISKLLNLPIVIARLDGLVSSLLGSTAKNIRKIFDYASRRECILFLDEFDVIAKLRDDQNDLGELKRVVNSLLQNIDSFSSGNILIAATNHHELLDGAVWRRFNNIIFVDKPNRIEIEELLELKLKTVNNNILETQKNMNKVVNFLNGLTHANIDTIINNVIRKNIIANKEEITSYDLANETYLYKNHKYDEDKFLVYLKENKFTHNEIHTQFNIPLRKIREVRLNSENE